MKRPRQGDFYESIAERDRNNGYWGKKYKWALERFLKRNTSIKRLKEARDPKASA